MARPSKDHVELFHDYGIHIPTRTLSLEGTIDDNGGEDGVNYSMCMKFIKNMHVLETASKEPITIIINTSGGSVADGMAIYDRIKESSCHIIARVYGCAQSMGSIILQAADERILKPHAQIMFHLGSGATIEGSPLEVLSHAQFEASVSEMVDNIMYEQIKKKFDAENKAFTKGKFKELTFRGKYMTAKEAIEYGLADEIEYPTD